MKKIIFPLLLTVAIAGGTFMGLAFRSSDCICGPACDCSPCTNPACNCSGK